MIYKRCKYYTEEDNCSYPDEDNDGVCIKGNCEVIEFICPNCKEIIK